MTVLVIKKRVRYEVLVKQLYYKQYLLKMENSQINFNPFGKMVPGYRSPDKGGSSVRIIIYANSNTYFYLYYSCKRRIFRRYQQGEINIYGPRVIEGFC